MLDLVPYKAKDYTLYIELESPEFAKLGIQLTPKSLMQVERTVRLEGADGRALACLCFQGKFVSITVRDASGPRPLLTPGVGNDEGRQFAPDDAEDDHLASIAALCSVLQPLIFPSSKEQGIVIVAGSTASGKSQIARALVRLYLTSQKSTKRRPHLLTYEDPIERLWRVQPENPTNEGIDYTPREKGVDAENLKDVVKASLRQTPTLLYVGETRDRADWEDLLHYAGTGHVGITTTHAGSITEAMSMVFSSVRAKTAADRAEVAEKILAVMHVRPVKGGDRSALLPSLWKRSRSGLNSLVSDGLSSVVPSRPRLDDTNVSCFGRRWFAEKLIRDNLLNHPTDSELDSLLVAATQHDLEGV